MQIPTEPIGSIPRPLGLVEAAAAGKDPALDRARYDEAVRDTAEFIPIDRLGTTDDCGFSPFCDDTSTSRDTAFAKIRSRVIGTQLASDLINDK